MKHTPGPWIAEETSPHSEMDMPAAFDISDGITITAVVYCTSNSERSDKAAANARLIAAAPELLDELKSALRIFERDQVKASPAQYARIRAAIAKAEATP